MLLFCYVGPCLQNCVCKVTCRDPYVLKIYVFIEVNQYFMFTASVLVILHPVHDSQSSFYTLVRVLYPVRSPQSVVRSPYFILTASRSWSLKGTDESTLDKDSSVPLMQHDPSDLGSVIRIQIIPKERTLSVYVISTKVLIEDTLFMSPAGDGIPISTWSSKLNEGLTDCR